MTDIVRRNTDTWTDVLPAVGDLAGKIAATDFVPDAMRGKPAVVAAAILYGRELGMEPMTALRSINVIKGKPALSSEAMRALILAAGHDLRFVEMTATRCIVEGKRRGQDEATRVAYTMDDAKKAGLAGQQQYAKMPRQMLAARATAELARLIFADVIGGLLSDIEADETEPTEPATTRMRARRAATETVDIEPEPVIEDPDPEPAPIPTDIVDDAEIIDADIIEDNPETLLIQELGAAPLDAVKRGAALVREALNQPGTKAAPISKQQTQSMMAAFTTLGVVDREERLAVTRAILERDNLETAKDLTHEEAHTVLTMLRAYAESEDPAALIRGLLE